MTGRKSSQEAGKGRASRPGLRDEKRWEFESEGGRNASTGWVLVGAIAFITVLVVGGLVIGSTGSSAPRRARVAGRQDYTVRNVKQRPVKAGVANGDVSVSLADLRKYNFLSFRYKKSGVEVPLLALITPSGRLYTATSMCEPCRSNEFHTERDGTLTCNACGTKWDLETFDGISGGCLNYPPQEIKSEVRGGRIIIKESAVRHWKPRSV